MISIFTPVHAAINSYLNATLKSVLEQTFTDWEWIILLNNGGEFSPTDSRIKVYTTQQSGIGALKRQACEYATGDILVELDGDDLLTSHALAEIAKAFKDPAIQFVHSNSAEFEVSRTPFEEKDERTTYSKVGDLHFKSQYYSDVFGWRHREYDYKGARLNEMIAFPSTAQSIRYIYWAPNHVRAFRKEAYWAVGGHNPNLPVGDDHDLIMRFYIAYGEEAFYHVDQCLYLYRVHENNTVKTKNGAIQAQTEQNYINQSRRVFERWAEDKGLLKLDLGGRFNKSPGYLSVDIEEPCDIYADLDQKWPWNDNSVGIIKASHIFEHLKDPIHTMNEAYRVLAPGGFLLVEVPSTDGRGAFQDPSHVSFWNSNSFWYYTDQQYARFIPSYKGRFQLSRVVNYYPDEFWKNNEILVTSCDLIALKPGYEERVPGEKKI